MGEKQKILIVDDQYGVRTLLKLALNKYNIKEAVNGQQALEIAATWMPDLIIIDMKMPGLTGIDTISRIQKLNIRSKILLMTAYDDIPLQGANISGFISKPFDIDVLIQLVENILKENTNT